MSVELLHGDCIEVMKGLPEKSVHCVVTSPPYFALRSYLPKDDPMKVKEIGSEPTPEAFIATMVDVFREVRRVLRDDGVIFVNLGDSYATSGMGGNPAESAHRKQATNTGSLRPGRKPSKGFDGHLLNIPHRVAEALRQDGWIWRQTIVWAKRSPMPESLSGWKWVRCRVKVASSDRGRNKHAGGNGQKPQGERDGDAFASTAKFTPCPGCPKCEKNGGYVLRRGKGRATTAHEYVFLFAKSEKYFWDGEASREPTMESSKARLKQNIEMQKGSCRANGGFKVNGPMKAVGNVESGRNPRSVWTLSSEPTSERHFATFPSELVRRCLVAGVSAKGCCPTCGAPWAPVVESTSTPRRDNDQGYDWGEHRGDGDKSQARRPNGSDVAQAKANDRCLGYRQTCDCSPHEPAPCTVMDPFNGIGTTGQTARHLGHHYIGIDLNQKYLDVAAKRIQQPPRWWLRLQKKAAKRVLVLPGQRELF